MKNPDESFEESKARKKKGSQGKTAEAAVQKLLDQRQREGKISYIRLLDARTCGKPVPAAPADFVVFQESCVATLLEVKQISKGDRLPKKSFTQLPRMLSMKQAWPMLVVYLAGTDSWWSMDVTRMDLSAASWKVNEELGYKIKLEELFNVNPR